MVSRDSIWYTNKDSKLRTASHPIEGKAQRVEDVPAPAEWILDGMAILHSMKDIPRTFSSLG